MSRLRLWLACAIGIESHFAFAGEVSGQAARKQEARRLLDAGVGAWDAGEYLTALDDFQKAEALYPSPKLRFNIARVLADLGRDVDALAAFEGFLADVKTSDEAVGAAKAKVAVLNGRVGKLSLHCSAPDAQVALDGKRVPREVGLRVAPGIHQVTGERAGYLPYIASVSVLPAQEQRVAIEFKKASVERPLRKRWWLWATVTGLAAAAATGIALGVVYGRPRAPEGSLGSVSPQTSVGLTNR